MFDKSIFLILSFMFQEKMNSRTFYSSKVIHHHFPEDAYSEIEESKHGNSILITGPPNNGEDSDIEIEDEDDIGRSSDVPNEVVGELDVFFFGL